MMPHLPKGTDIGPAQRPQGSVFQVPWKVLGGLGHSILWPSSSFLPPSLSSSSLSSFSLSILSLPHTVSISVSSPISSASLFVLPHPSVPAHPLCHLDRNFEPFPIQQMDRGNCVSYWRFPQSHMSLILALWCRRFVFCTVHRGSSGLGNQGFSLAEAVGANSSVGARLS